MATLNVSGTGKSGKALTATLTYTIASTNTQTTLTLSGFSRTHGDLESYWVDVAVEIDGGSVWDSSDLGGTQDALPKTITWNRGTSAQQKALTLRIYENIWRNGNIESGYDFANNTNLTVPALTSYNVTYNANGHGTAPGTQKKYYGKTLALANAITATGYTFVRWNTAANNTGTGYAAGGSYTANAALTLYAIWNRTVTYNANGGSGAPLAQTALATNAITLSSTEPTRAGYKFNGWNTKSDGSGTGYNQGGTYAAGAASVTLYAVWKKIINTATIGDARAIRVSSPTSTEEADEGEYAYIQIPYTVKGAAAADVSAVVTVIADDSGAATVTYDSAAAQKQEGADLAGTFIARASGCNIEKRYTVAITITAVNTSDTQTSVTATRAIILPTAFFTIDALSGGHGIHFGGPATEEGFFVSMAACFKELIELIRETGDTYFKATRDDTDVSVGFGVGSGGTNHGIWSYLLNKWLVHGDGTDIYIGNLKFTDAASARGSINAVNKAGDTMTGNLAVSATDATERRMIAKNSLIEIDLVANASGTHGLYSRAVVSGDDSGWIIYKNSSDHIIVAGINLSSQTANKVLASPNGATGAPTFRALVAADLPTVTVAKGGTGASTASPNRVFAGPGSGSAAAAPSFRALVAADLPIVPVTKGGTGKTYGYTWQSLGSCTGTGNKTFDLTNYSEILIAAKFGGKLVTTVIPKGLLTTSDLEVWISGGKSANDASAASGAMRAVCKITTTKLTGVASNNGATDTTASTTWYIYAR